MKKLLIESGGIVTMIYDDADAALIAQGTATINRVSHVEPDTRGGWSAQMIDGPLLGPFTLRAGALAAETDYLTEKLFN